MAYAIKHGDKKALAQDSFELELKNFDESDRSFDAVASVESADRAGDIIMVKGWDLTNYMKNPVVLAHHNYYSPPIGISARKPWVVGNKLKFRPKFSSTNPEADILFNLYKEKMLRGFSVGFLPIESEKMKNDKEDPDKPLFQIPTRFIKQELLEVSAVSIPAHQDALAEIKTFVRRGLLDIPARYLDEELFELEKEEIIVDGEPLDVSPDEFSQMVKSSVKACLGQLEDEDFIR